MRKLIPICILAASLAVSNADIISFDLSPSGTDHAVGLSWANEVPAVTNSSGTGNEIGQGILFDTSTLVMSLSIGYGSAFGFTDLTGPATGMHIHGDAPTNLPAPVIISLIPNHTPATNPATGGFIGGTVTYPADQVPFLLAGSNYINIHTATNPAGEIRGQLIPVNTFPTVTCPAASTNECTGATGTLILLNAQVGDADGDALTVVWTVDGATVQTNIVPAGAPPTSTMVSLMAQLDLGQHSVAISVADTKGGTASCTTTATIVDTTPPVITSASASPNVLWPPNHKMHNIALSVTATDLCSTVTCHIKNVTSNEPVNGPGKGKGNKAPDWKTTGPLSLQLRAEREGKGHGRTYTITVECVDTSGNAATTNLTVTVPHDQRGHSNGKGQGNSNDSGSDSDSNSGSNGNSNGNGHGKGHGHNG